MKKLWKIAGICLLAGCGADAPVPVNPCGAEAEACTMNWADVTFTPILCVVEEGGKTVVRPGSRLEPLSTPLYSCVCVPPGKEIIRDPCGSACLAHRAEVCKVNRETLCGESPQRSDPRCPAIVANACQLALAAGGP